MLPRILATLGAVGCASVALTHRKALAEAPSNDSLQQDVAIGKTISESNEQSEIIPCLGKPDPIEASRSYVERQRILNGVPGLVIGVSQKGKTLWIEGFGFADIENGVKCHRDTVMPIASISKTITAVLAAKLWEEGKLDINASIRKYLSTDEFPDKTWEGKKVDITIRQLMSHLGGIRHYKFPKKDDKDKEAESKQKKDEKSKKDAKSATPNNNTGLKDSESAEFLLNQPFRSTIDALKLFKDDPLIAAPGTKFYYTTFGWTLISACIEKVLPEGKKFEDYLVNEFCIKQLGLKNTYLDVHGPLILNRSRTYWKVGNGSKTVIQNAPCVDKSYKWAGGGLASTVPDLLKFGNMLLYSNLGQSPDGLKGFLKQETIKEMVTPHPLSFRGFTGYGLGLDAVKDGKPQSAFCAGPEFENYFGHTGGAVGATSILFIEPRSQTVVVILCNVESSFPLYKVAFRLAHNFASSE